MFNISYFSLNCSLSTLFGQLLLQPPSPHAPIRGCVFADQRTLTRAWALASAYVAWDARPGTLIMTLPLPYVLFSRSDISKSFLESSLTPLAEHLTCKLCKKSLNERIRDLVVHWSIVKVPFSFLNISQDLCPCSALSNS